MGLWDSFTRGLGTGLEWFVGGTAAVGGAPQVTLDPQQRKETTAAIGTGVATGAALVDQGITTGLLTLDTQDPGGASLDPRTNWRNAKYVSPGQAIVAGFNNYVGAQNTGSSPREQVNQAITGQRPVGYFDASGNWVGTFRDNRWASVVSGGSDAVFDWYADPTVVAGKGIKVGRAATFTRSVDSAKDVAKAVTRIESGKGGWGAAISATKGMSTAEMLRLDWVRQSVDPDLLASTLRFVADDTDEAVDYAAKAQVLRAGLGDKATLDALRTEKPAVADALANARKNVLKAQKAPVPDAAELDRLEGVYKDLLVRDELLARLVNDADEAAPTRALAGTVGRERTVSMFGSWEKAKARGASRAAKGGPAGSVKTDPNGGFVYETTRAGKGFRPVTVMRWVGDERPAGFVAVSGAPVADASREVAAFARRSRLNDMEWVDKFTRETTDQGRSAVARQLESEAWVRVANEYGMDPDAAMALYREMGGRRQQLIDAYKGRAFGVNEDESLIVDPMLTSQLADSVPMFDVDVLRNMLRDEQASGGLAQLALMKGEDAAIWMQTKLDVYWRPAVLIRGGYAPRNLFEGAGRALATLPSMFRELPGGTARFARNRVDGAANAVDSALYGTPQDLAERIRVLSVEAESIRARAQVPAQGALPTLGNAVDPADVARLDQIAREVEDLSARLDERVATKKIIGERRMAGTGSIDLGDGFTANDAFSGSAGKMALTNSSGAGTRAATLDPQALLEAEKLGEWGTVKVSDANYFDAFAQTARQFANDPIARKVLAGESWGDITRWLRSAKAADVRRAYGITREGAYQKVGEVGGLVTRYIPEDARLAVLGDEVPGATEWAKMLGGRELPTIHGRRIVEETRKRPATFQDGWMKFTDTAFKYIGTLPEDRLLRHPFYRTAYRAELQRQKALWTGQGGELSNQLVREWEAVAHKAALKDVKRTLYTIERYSNVAYYGRFLAPFLAATNNTIRTWSRIIGRDPAVLARANLIWQAPSNAGLLWDSQENKAVPRGQNIGLDSRYQVLLPIPKSWTDKIGATNPDDPLSVLQFAPPQTSFNVALQSDPVWQPGYGPLVTVPTAIVANKYPDSKIVSWIANDAVFPQGVPREAWKSVLPAWIRQAINKEDQDGTSYGRIYATMLVREQERFRNGERSTEPTPDEIENRANSWFTLRILGAAGLPFAATLRDPNFEFYVTEAQRYRREGGLQWFDKFIADYPDAGEYAFSVSQNPSGIRATTGDVANAKRYDSLIREVAGDDPSLVGLVTNDGTPYEFDSASFNWQYGRSVTPGSDTQFRGPQSAEEATKAARVQQGWTEFRSMRTQRDALLAARGLSPNQINNNAAADIKARWDQWVEFQKSNPAGNKDWWEAYQQRDGAAYEKTITGMRKILADPKFRQGLGSAPEFGMLEQYIATRDQMLGFLAQRKQAGFSGTLSAESNADVARVWFDYVDRLAASNTRFNDIYVRYLDGEFERPDVNG